MEMGKRGIIYLSLHSHHQNDSCIKMGSDKSQFSVWLIVRDKATRQCPQLNHNFWRERWAEAESTQTPSAYQPKVLPLGQTGSHVCKVRLGSYFSLEGQQRRGDVSASWEGVYGSFSREFQSRYCGPSIVRLPPDGAARSSACVSDKC